MKPIPILIDTDPGVDDFFCIAIGCAFQELFNLTAITTIGGNNTTDATTKNALDILHLFHREDVPVARGNDAYLCHEFGEPVVKFHGANGLGNVEIPSSTQKIDVLCAADKIHEQALLYPGELIVVTVGPETNLALALQKYNDLPKLIKKIVVMGGTLKQGNVTPYAEANIYHDVEAADIVFSSGIPIDMVGLNVTRQAPMLLSIFDGLENIREDVEEVMKELIIFRNQEALHDSIAIASLVRDDIIDWKETNLTIINDNSEQRGQTVMDDSTLPYRSRVAIGIHKENYEAVMKDMILRFKK